MTSSSSNLTTAAPPTEKLSPSDAHGDGKASNDAGVAQAAQSAWSGKDDNILSVLKWNSENATTTATDSLPSFSIGFTNDVLGDVWKTVDPIFGFSKLTSEVDPFFSELESKIKPALQLDEAFDWLLDSKDEKTSISDANLNSSASGADKTNLKDTATSIDETDKTGTMFHKDKVTGTITETGPEGTKFERQKDGTMTLTEGDRKFVLTPDNKLTETTGGRTIEITDKETISTFRANSVKVFQHNCRNVPESEQKQPGVHTLENGLIRVNSSDGTKITVYPDGRKVIESTDGTQYLVAKGQQSIVMVTKDGHKYLIDKDHNRSLVEFNADGTLKVENQTISTDGKVTTSDNVQVAAQTNATTIKNANGDGKDVKVNNDTTGVSTVTDGTGLSTSVDDNTGKVTQRNPDGKVDVFDTVNHQYNIQTADGVVNLSHDLTTLWNGDVFNAVGDVMRASGTFIGADNSVRLSDGSGYDSYGNSVSARSESQSQAELASSLSSTAKSKAAEISYLSQTGQANSGQIGELLAMYSQLGDVAGRCTALGQIGAAATATFAQSDCSSGINTAMAQLNVKAQAESAVGSLTPDQISQIQRATSGAPSEQLLNTITQSA